MIMIMMIILIIIMFITEAGRIQTTCARTAPGRGVSLVVAEEGLGSRLLWYVIVFICIYICTYIYIYIYIYTHTTTYVCLSIYILKLRSRALRKGCEACGGALFRLFGFIGGVFWVRMECPLAAEKVLAQTLQCVGSKFWHTRGPRAGGRRSLAWKQQDLNASIVSLGARLGRGPLLRRPRPPPEASRATGSCPARPPPGPGGVSRCILYYLVFSGSGL